MKPLCTNFDSQVVKNVASQSSEVKKLVYLYLLHYAEKYVKHIVSFGVFVCASTCVCECNLHISFNLVSLGVQMKHCYRSTTSRKTWEIQTRWLELGRFVQWLGFAYT